MNEIYSEKGPLHRKVQQPAIIFQVPETNSSHLKPVTFPKGKDLCHRISGAKILVSGSVSPPVRNVELISVSNVFGDYPTYDQPSFLRGYVGFQGSSSQNPFKDHLRNPILMWEDLPFHIFPSQLTLVWLFSVYIRSGEASNKGFG